MLCVHPHPVGRYGFRGGYNPDVPSLEPSVLLHVRGIAERSGWVQDEYRCGVCCGMCCHGCCVHVYLQQGFRYRALRTVLFFASGHGSRGLCVRDGTQAQHFGFEGGCLTFAFIPSRIYHSLLRGGVMQMDCTGILMQRDNGVRLFGNCCDGLGVGVDEGAGDEDGVPNLRRSK